MKVALVMVPKSRALVLDDPKMNALMAKAATRTT